MARDERLLRSGGRSYFKTLRTAQERAARALQDAARSAIILASAPFNGINEIIELKESRLTPNSLRRGLSAVRRFKRRPFRAAAVCPPCGNPLPVSGRFVGTSGHERCQNVRIRRRARPQASAMPSRKVGPPRSSGPLRNPLPVESRCRRRSRGFRRLPVRRGCGRSRPRHRLRAFSAGAVPVIAALAPFRPFKGVLAALRCRNVRE